MVARLQRQQQGGRRPEPAREAEALRAALERGEHLLQRLARRVAGARVVPGLRLADRGLRVRRGLVDRHVDRAVLGLGVLADVDRPGLEPHRVLAHGARPAHRISGGIAHFRRLELVDRILPLAGAGPQRRLALGVVPGRELATGERGAAGIAAGARREPRERRLLARASGCGGTAVRAGGERGGGQDDLALPRIAGGAEPAFEREQPRERRERRVDLVGRPERRRVDRLRAQHRPPPRVGAHALRREEPGQHHRRCVREHLDRRTLHGAAAVPGERVLDHAERPEADRHPLVERDARPSSDPRAC